jgi:hypothetical protein
MDATLALSAQARVTAGILLLAIVTIEWGGLFVMRLARGGQEATPFQVTFNRAGHGHAGMLVTLALLTQLLADAAALEGVVAWVARYGVAWAAILMPAGFFFSAAGAGRTHPNRMIVLLYAGAVVLAAGVVALGFGLLLA